MYTTVQPYLVQNPKGLNAKVTLSKESWTKVNQPSLLTPSGPISFTSNTWHHLDLRLRIDIEVGPTLNPLAINSRHCFHLLCWMFEAHETVITMKVTPYNFSTSHALDSIQKSPFEMYFYS